MPGRVLRSVARRGRVLAAVGLASGGDGGTTDVTVGVIPTVDVAPIYLGVEQGFFEEQGLNLKLQTARGGAAIVPVVVGKDSPVRTAADLAGKRVAVNTLKNINTTTVNEAVRKAGGDPSGIEYVEPTCPDIVPAITRGDVDAGQVVEPFLTTANSQGLREVSSNHVATDPDLTVAMYFATRRSTRRCGSP